MCCSATRLKLEIVLKHHVCTCSWEKFSIYVCCSGSWYKVSLKLKTSVDQSGIHLLHDSQQLQRNMVSHLREKNIEKF